MARPTIRSFSVLPSLPERLSALQKIAYNLWWCWHADAVTLFRRVDTKLFESLDNSPIRLLGAVNQDRLEELTKDESFLVHLDRVSQSLDRYLNETTWFQKQHPQYANMKVAYFSAEFGIHESMPVYSGGLGVLAGDHLKSSSDLGLPLCGVTMMYREGYFRQYLNADGWQQERYPENDFFNLPLVAELGKDGQPLIVTAPLPGREIFLKIWRIQIGRVPLYLLDANIPQNKPEDRAITARLYGGDTHMRIQQEIVLGIAGIRALRAMGINPTVCHMNEGHSAFCTLERIRLMMSETKCDLATAQEAVKAGTVFTTHTPVPAGNDTFPIGMVDQYLGDYLRTIGIDYSKLAKLGRQIPEQDNEPFGMTVLAIKLANSSNGVSKLHGDVSRKMWNSIWPTLPTSEIPISSVTNGVHTPSWLSPEISQLFEHYVDMNWDRNPADHAIWTRVDSIPDLELWRVHTKSREQLIAFARARTKVQKQRLGAIPADIAACDELLDPEALTIGFARRFATYKRGDLLFRDADRLAKLVNDTKRPVQIIFSGKAHPKDNGGKELIARVAQMTKRPEFRNRIVFIEDYDMNIARHLIQGVDVWLNNPRRPLEASGTSGMKVSCNGGLNLSILDGWWCEGYNGQNGWAIGSGEEYTDLGYQDEVEGRALYDLIEREIVPLFYDRGSDQLPRNWIQRMKNSIRTLSPVFNTNRMVEEYLTSIYEPAHKRYAATHSSSLKGATELSQWRSRIQSDWQSIRVENIETPSVDILRVGGSFDISVRVHLGPVRPQDVDVQACFGKLDNSGTISEPKVMSLDSLGQSQDGRTTFKGRVSCSASGQFGLAVRVLPNHPLLPNKFEPCLVTWA
jgi:glycogen phosphorylase